MLRLSDLVVVLDCPALVSGSYTGHVPVRAAPVELPYQATAEAVQAPDVAGQPDSGTESQAAATTQVTLRRKRNRRRPRLANDQSCVNAGDAAANMRHAAIQPMLQSAFAVFQDWLSTQEVQRLPDALRRGGAVPSDTGPAEAATAGPSCSTPASAPVPVPQAASSGDAPAREGDLDLLALAELKAVLKPKFRFLAPGGELPGGILADARAASGPAQGSTGSCSSLHAFRASSAASTASRAQHCSSCLSSVPSACTEVSAGTSARRGAQYRCSCLRSDLLPPDAPGSPIHAAAVASVGSHERAGIEGSAEGCNLFDVLIDNERGEERTALAFQTRVVVPPRARFLLSDVTRLRPLLPGVCALCVAGCPRKSVWQHTS